jgi:cell division septation protein DedD
MEGGKDRSRRQAEGRGGLLSAIIGALLLMAGGFALGVVAGLVVEDPGLVADYASGRTETVAVEGGSAPAAAVGEADAPAEGEHPADVALAAPPEAPEAPRAESRPPPSRIEPADTPATDVGAPPREEGFAVQVGAFGDAEAAQKLADRLRGHGFSVYVSPSASAGEPRWRVRVGPVDTRDDASQLAERLHQRERLPTWVLAEGAP